MTILTTIPFFHEGNKLQYSLKHTIDFTGKAQNVCVVWNKHNQDEKKQWQGYTM